MMSKKLRGSVSDRLLSIEEQQIKINEVRKLIGRIMDKHPTLCSDASLSRYLRARNWHSKKAAKMLLESLQWRIEHKPEKIHWEDIAREAETGKVYMPNYLDKNGRIVLIMRPGFQNSSSMSGQIKYLVYCMEHAIFNLNLDQEQILWLIDFQRWNMGSISLKVTREIAHILQDHYPERLGVAILYDPPKVFESFWTMVKPVLEQKTYKKVRFVYSNSPQSRKTMEELFDIEKLESTFGGKNLNGFNYAAYAQKMIEEDKKMSTFISSGCSSPTGIPPIASDSLTSDVGSEESDEGCLSPTDETAASNVEVIDEKMHSLQIGCKDVAKAEARASREVQI